ncbi:MAG: heme ABC transporter ATP-binding protein [Aphanocapsa lilacina HA4352-LM1]|nr:heme ABC transporter ATP-binding protein [Aphanocapsa lilacina HA4352-LM1]
MLKAEGVGVHLGGRWLLEQVSLEAIPGEVIAIIGPNGAGKSTLLKTLAGEIRPTRGSVSMAGKPLADWPARERACVRAVLPQSSTLAFAFRAFEVVLMGRTPHSRGLEGERDRHIAREAMAAAGVAHLTERLYPTLSGGERQRVQLARVLAQIWEAPPDSPRYLLLDEPTASLDLTHQHGTLVVARGFARQGAAVITVLHDLNLAAQYADRLALLKDGKLLVVGPPDIVLTAEWIETGFGLQTLVLRHPRLGCPLVIALGTASVLQPGEQLAHGE